MLSARVALKGGPPRFLLYAVWVLNFKLQSIIFFLVLVGLIFPVSDYVEAGDHDAVAPKSEATIPNIESPLPCTELVVTALSVVCKSRLGIVARLDFPKVHLQTVLAGREYLPRAREIFTVDEKTIGEKTYRNIAFLLWWEPATPEFLQIYLNEYLPYWENRIPYRLFWNVQYEECSIDHCSRWQTVSVKGEILPANVKDLPSDLAADVNFNGVPAAFWNTHVIP